MTVSVVIPVKNRPVVLERAIESALNQTIKPSEIVVVDDGSTDETPSVVERMAAQVSSIKLVRCETSGGAPVARNIGVRASKGDFIAFLDSDDIWKPKKLEVQLELFRRFPDTPAVFSGVLYRYLSRGTEVRRPGAASASPEDLMCGNIIGSTSSVVVRRESFVAVGGFDESLPNCEDWDMWLRLSRLGTLRGVQDDLLIYSFDGSDKLSRNYEKLLRGHEMVINSILLPLRGSDKYDSVASMLELKMAEINIRITGNRGQALRHFAKALSHRASTDILVKIAKLSAISVIHGNRS